MALSMNWLTAAILSLLSFGVWGLLTKLTVNHIDARSALLYQFLGLACVVLVLLVALKFRPETAIKGIGFGMLTGIANGIGCLFYFAAVDKGKVTTVVTLTALYPIITIALAFLVLKEGINIKQGIGVLFALSAIYLFTSS